MGMNPFREFERRICRAGDRQVEAEIVVIHLDARSGGLQDSSLVLQCFHLAYGKWALPVCQLCHVDISVFAVFIGKNQTVSVMDAPLIARHLGNGYTIEIDGAGLVLD